MASLPAWGTDQGELRRQCLLLSREKWNVLQTPDDDEVGDDWHFDLVARAEEAAACLREDPVLRELRFRLVPRHIAEECFWYNYFARVDLLKRAMRGMEAGGVQAASGGLRANDADEHADKEPEEAGATEEPETDDPAPPLVQAETPPVDATAADAIARLREEIARELAG